MHCVRWWLRLATVATTAALVGSLAVANAHAAVGPAVQTEASPPQGVCPPLDTAPVPLGPEGVVPFAQPTLSWRPVPGIDEYVVLILLQSGNEQTVWGPTHVVGRTSVTAPPLPPFTEMRWKVKTECDERYGPFSPSMYFTIEPSNTAPCPPAQAPVVLGPQPGRTGDPRPTLSWRPVSGTTSYTVYVLAGDSDAVVASEQDIHGTTYTPPQALPTGTPLRWKVKAESPCGPGPYSPSVHFDIGTVEACGMPGPATPYGPQETLIRNRPLFRWGEAPGASLYTLYLLRLDNGAPLMVEVVYGTTFTPAVDLPVGLELRWFVQGSNRCADGYYSAAPEFRIR
jgi:hypothetical protein